ESSPCCRENLCSRCGRRKPLERAQCGAKTRFRRGLDALHTVGLEQTACETAEDDGGCGAKPRRIGLGKSLEQPYRRGRRGGQECGEGPLDDLPLEVFFSRPRHLSVKHGARHSGPAVTQTFGQLRERVFAARKQDAPTPKIVGEALENALGRS